MRLIITKDEIISKKDYALNIILASLNRKCIARNRRILHCFFREFKLDKDYFPWNDEKREQFIKDRKIKDYLD